MKWVRPKRQRLPTEALPDPDWVVVRHRVVKAGLGDQMDKVLGFVRDVTADYLRDVARDDVVAWPGQGEAFRDRIREATGMLELSKEDKTILRATAISPFAFEDTRDLLARLVTELEALADKTGKPTPGGARAVVHARQFALAQRFWAAFKSNDWPTTTSPNSLMPQLLKVVLNTAGEKRATIKRLLQEAKPNS